MVILYVNSPLNDQDGVPDQPADTVETSVGSNDPILGFKDIVHDFWLYASQTESRALDSVGICHAEGDEGFPATLFLHQALLYADFPFLAKILTTQNVKTN